MNNTVVIHLMGDNGASVEASPYGLLDVVNFFTNIPVPLEGIYARLEELGGLNTFRHFSAAWAQT